jgi:predicted protein tyrosine phosphatase
MGNQFFSKSDDPVTDCNPHHDLDQDLIPFLAFLQDPEATNWKTGKSSEEILRHAARQCQLPVEVLPHIYLSANVQGRDTDRLNHFGITHVYNVTSLNSHNNDVDYASHNIIKMHDPAEHEEDYPMLPIHFERFKKFVEDAVESNADAKVLVHCVSGLNRSGVLVAAYLMVHSQQNVLETVKRLRLLRGNHAISNEGFQRQLVELARDEGLLGPTSILHAPFVAKKKKPLPRSALEQLS